MKWRSPISECCIINKSLFLICAFLLFHQLSYAQAKLRFEKKSHDFGKVSNLDYPPAVFTFINSGNEKLAILMVNGSSFVKTIYTKGYIEPGFSGQILVYPNVNEMGKFKETITIVTNGSPNENTIAVSGEILSVQACFINPENMNLRKITVIDSETKEPIPESDILLLHNGSKKIKGFTNNKGEWQGEMPIGQYQFNISANGYEPHYEEKFIKRSVPYMYFELTPIKKPVMPRANEVITSAEPRNNEKRQSEIPVDQYEEITDFGFDDDVFSKELEFDENELLTNNKEDQPSPMAQNKKEYNADGTLSNNYAANNIVFLVDASHSMNSYKRLDLLKQSVLNLINILRPIDNVSLITYAGSTTVIFENVSGEKKELMAEYINNIKASGITKGVQGLESAYEMANAKFSAGGNNQIILATDGNFTGKNNNTNNIIKRIEINAQKGIILSIIGIGVNYEAKEFMKNLVLTSKGSYIDILDKEDISATLIEEIKSKSLRK